MLVYNIINRLLSDKRCPMNYTVTISENLFTKAQSLAESSSQSVDEIIQKLLRDSLDQPRLALPQDEQTELKALSYLTDATLFTIAREQMPESLQAQMQQLMDKNNQSTLTVSEQQTLTQLVEDGQRLMLRKAEALKLLISRGHTITLESLAADNG
jgi:hypothetical protein